MKPLESQIQPLLDKRGREQIIHAIESKLFEQIQPLLDKRGRELPSANFKKKESEIQPLLDKRGREPLL